MHENYGKGCVLPDRRVETKVSVSNLSLPLRIAFAGAEQHAEYMRAIDADGGLELYAFEPPFDTVVGDIRIRGQQEAYLNETVGGLHVAVLQQPFTPAIPNASSRVGRVRQRVERRLLGHTERSLSRLALLERQLGGVVLSSVFAETRAQVAELTESTDIPNWRIVQLTPELTRSLGTERPTQIVERLDQRGINGDQHHRQLSVSLFHIMRRSQDGDWAIGDWERLLPYIAPNTAQIRINYFRRDLHPKAGRKAVEGTFRGADQLIRDAQDPRSEIGAMLDCMNENRLSDVPMPIVTLNAPFYETKRHHPSSYLKQVLADMIGAIRERINNSSSTS